MADLNETIVLETTKGRVVIALRPDLAPNHVERIKTLASQGFYDGVPFHRVIDGFMAQTGDPTGTGSGGSELPDLNAEFNAEPHVRGTCSMARTNFPHSPTRSSSSASSDARFLDRQYTVWGKVIEGMDVGRHDQARRARARARPDREGHRRGGLSLRQRWGGP